MAKIADMAEKLTDTVVDTYQKIEDGVVSGYRKIEDGVVEGFCKVSDKFIEKLFIKDGESAEDAKLRLCSKQSKADVLSGDSSADAGN